MNGGGPGGAAGSGTAVPAARRRTRRAASPADRRLRRWRRRALRRQRRAGQAVRERRRRPDRVAAARGAGAARDRARADPARAPHRPPARLADRVGRLDGGDGAGVLPDGGDLPPVLHGGARARDRRAGRHRRGAAVAAPSVRGRAVGAGRAGGGHGRVGVGAARPDAGVRAVAAVGRSSRSAWSGRRCCSCPAGAGVVAAAALVAAVGVGPPRPGRLRGGHRGRRASQGSIPLAGPADRAVGSALGGGRGDRQARDRGGDDGGTQAARRSGTRRRRDASGATSGTTGGAAAGGAAGAERRQAERRQAAPDAGRPARWPGRGQATDPALVSLLQAAGTKWSAATVGSMQAAPLALGSGTDVMAIGGFSGGDPAPTLEQFQAYVAAGQVHYFIAGRRLRRARRGGERAARRSARGWSSTSPRPRSAAAPSTT